MNRIVIIDEKKDRKNQTLASKEVEDLEPFCRESFPESLNDLDPYSMVAVHESLVKKLNRYGDLIDYAKENKKFLILFSGGTTHNYIGNHGMVMKINSAEFYKKNKLLTFVNMYCSNLSMEQPLMQFLYGEHWKLPLLLRYRNLLFIYEDRISDIKNYLDAQEEEFIRTVIKPDAPLLSKEYIDTEIETLKYKIK